MCYDCREDVHFIREFPRHKLVSQLRLAHISLQVRELRVFYEFREIVHWSIECP